MAEKLFYIGNTGPFFYDTAVTPHAFTTDGSIAADEGVVTLVGFDYPLNHVLMNTDNIDPSTIGILGTWTSLGTLVIGTTTIYFWQRTA